MFNSVQLKVKYHLLLGTMCKIICFYESRHNHNLSTCQQACFYNFNQSPVVCIFSQVKPLHLSPTHYLNESRNLCILLVKIRCKHLIEEGLAHTLLEDRIQQLLIPTLLFPPVIQTRHLSLMVFGASWQVCRGDNFILISDRKG